MKAFDFAGHTNCLPGHMRPTGLGLESSDLDFDTPIDKYPIRLWRWSMQGKVICPGSQLLAVVRLELRTFHL